MVFFKRLLASTSLQKNQLATRLIGACVAVFFFIRVFWLETMPIITNDSLAYLDMEKNTGIFGGLRQLIEVRALKTIGYPLFLKLVEAFDFILPHDFLTNVALMQHLIWYVIILWAIASIGVWAIPVMMVMSAPFFVWSTNTILTEPLTIALASTLLLSSIELSRLLTKKNVPYFRVKWSAMVFLMTVSFVWIILVKFFYITTGLLVLAPVVAVFLHYGSRVKEFKLALIGASVVLAVGGSIVGLQSYYNYDRYNKFTPVSAQGRVLYWGVWTSAFILRNENRLIPEMAAYYDEKGLYAHINEATAECKDDFVCESQILDVQSEQLAQMAGISLPQERTRAFLMALLGGEKNELHYTRTRFLTKDRTNKYLGPEWIMDAFSQKKGPQSLIDKYNHGEVPTVIAGFSPWPVFDGYVSSAQFSIIFCYFFVCLWLLIKRRFRGSFHLFAGVTAHVCVCIAFSWFLTDIWRYLQTWWVLVTLTMAYFISLNMKVQLKNSDDINY